jgi:hypothetical protein
MGFEKYLKCDSCPCLFLFRFDASLALQAISHSSLPAKDCVCGMGCIRTEKDKRKKSQIISPGGRLEALSSPPMTLKCTLKCTFFSYHGYWSRSSLSWRMDTRANLILKYTYKPTLISPPSSPCTDRSTLYSTQSQEYGEAHTASRCGLSGRNTNRCTVGPSCLWNCGRFPGSATLHLSSPLGCGREVRSAVQYTLI